MYIDDFIWLPDILDKLAVKHHLMQEEVEEVFCNRPQYRFIESGYAQGKDVYSASGQTDAGRYLIVFFIYKATPGALILSDRDMDKKERMNLPRRWVRTDQLSLDISLKRPSQTRRLKPLLKNFGRGLLSGKL